MSAKVFYENVNFRLRDWRIISKLVDKVITKEGKISGDLCFIFTSDENIREINIKFLGRNYFTDVITFDYSERDLISGDIFISTDTVRINAKNYKVSYNQEILRVMIHGVLHLCGYDDKSKVQIEKMRKMEDYWITKK